MIAYMTDELPREIQALSARIDAFVTRFSELILSPQDLDRLPTECEVKFCDALCEIIKWGPGVLLDGSVSVGDLIKIIASTCFTLNLNRCSVQKFVEIMLHFDDLSNRDRDATLTGGTRVTMELCKLLMLELFDLKLDDATFEHIMSMILEYDDLVDIETDPENKRIALETARREVHAELERYPATQCTIAKWCVDRMVEAEKSVIEHDVDVVKNRLLSFVYSTVFAIATSCSSTSCSSSYLEQDVINSFMEIAYCVSMLSMLICLWDDILDLPRDLQANIQTAATAIQDPERLARASFALIDMLLSELPEKLRKKMRVVWLANLVIANDVRVYLESDISDDHHHPCKRTFENLGSIAMRSWDKSIGSKFVFDRRPPAPRPDDLATLGIPGRAPRWLRRNNTLR